MKHLIDIISMNFKRRLNDFLEKYGVIFNSIRFFVPIYDIKFKICPLYGKDLK